VGPGNARQQFSGAQERRFPTFPLTLTTGNVLLSTIIFQISVRDLLDSFSSDFVLVFVHLRQCGYTGELYNFIRHIGSHIQYKKAIYSKQNDEKVNNSVTIFNNTFE